MRIDETRREKRRDETRRDKTRHEKPRNETIQERQDTLRIAFSGLQNDEELRCERNIALIRVSHEP